MIIPRKYKKMLESGRYKAIIKELPNKDRILFGFERVSQSSRKYHKKVFMKAPINLSKLKQETPTHNETN